MRGKCVKLLVIEDNPADVDLLQEALAAATNTEFELTHIEFFHEAAQQLNQGCFDGILLDLFLPDIHGLNTFRQVHAIAPNIPIIVLTGLNDEEIAVEAIRAGAQDYFVKGQINSVLLTRAIRYAIERGQTLRQLQSSCQTHYDALTQLFNRQAFNHYLAQAMSSVSTENRQHIFCHLDLDYFKLINDTCGHAAGDELLRQVAGILRDKVGSTNILGRLGDDEFGLLLHNCPLQQALKIADELCQSFQEFRFAWQNQMFMIAASIGIVKLEAGKQNLDQVMSNADLACHAAKTKGQNHVHIYQPHDQILAKQPVEFQWFSRLVQAIEENRFCLYCQAIVPIRPARKLQKDYEILLRLVDETGQLVTPMAFIPPAERYNLMTKIDRWVIRTFCNYLSSLLKHRSNASITGTNRDPTTYALNLSGASINDEELIGFIKTQFELHQIPPQMICFEITETVAIANLNKAAKLIHELRAWGCRFALDDFGSGMSSLAYLKSLPVNYLKIDGNFIRNIANDPIDYAMVKAINNIGHVMGLQTIAEFVANAAILDQVSRLGVDYVQGYGIAEPQPLIPYSRPVAVETIGF
ncbi:MAG: EAL domain-containing protein [Cyanothece sp. SIO1E1]|nr:EAL domain-containing protein [Cyanothece sp. SIO1E1]